MLFIYNLATNHNSLWLEWFLLAGLVFFTVNLQALFIACRHVVKQLSDIIQVSVNIALEVHSFTNTQSIYHRNKADTDISIGIGASLIVM